MAQQQVEDIHSYQRIFRHIGKIVELIFQLFYCGAVDTKRSRSAFIDLYIKGKLSTLSTLDSSTPWLKEAGENCKPVYRSSTIILLPVMIIWI